MKKTLFVSFLLLCSLTLPGFAEAGKSGWPIFTLAQSANTRPTVSSSLQYGSMIAALRNPALLGARPSSELYVVSQSGFADDALGGMMYGQAFKHGGMLMVGGFYYDAGAVELNWLENGALMSQDVSLQKDYLGVLAYGIDVGESLCAGAAVKVASSELAERATASAYAMDLGLAFAATKRTTISLSIQNFGESSAYYLRKDPLPLTGNGALTYVVEKGSMYVLSGLSGAYNLVDNTLVTEAGLEIGYGVISVNGAYAIDADEGNMLMGVDLTFGSLEIAYSYAPGTYLNPVQKINVGWKF